MRITLKRAIGFGIIITTLALTLFLTSCDIGDWFESDIESAMDDILTGESYTMEHKAANDVYTTLKVADGELCVIYKIGEYAVEHYLFCDEETGKYYYAKVEGDGVQKISLTEEKYLMHYFTAFYTNSLSDKIFNYRYILDMAYSVSDTKYEYSKESYAQHISTKEEYSIEYDEDKLILTQRNSSSLMTEENRVLESSTIKTTYSLIGDTEITVPSKVLSTTAAENGNISITNNLNFENNFGGVGENGAE